MRRAAPGAPGGGEVSRVADEPREQPGGRSRRRRAPSAAPARSSTRRTRRTHQRDTEADQHPCIIGGMRNGIGGAGTTGYRTRSGTRFGRSLPGEATKTMEGSGSPGEGAPIRPRKSRRRWGTGFGTGSLRPAGVAGCLQVGDRTIGKVPLAHRYAAPFGRRSTRRPNGVAVSMSSGTFPMIPVAHLRASSRARPAGGNRVPNPVPHRPGVTLPRPDRHTFTPASPLPSIVFVASPGNEPATEPGTEPGSVPGSSRAADTVPACSR